MQDNNINEEKLNEMLQQASKKLGIPADQLKKKLQSGVVPDAQASNIISKMLNDKNAMEKLLNSPKARELIKKLMNGNNSNG